MVLVAGVSTKNGTLYLVGAPAIRLRPITVHSFYYTPNRRRHQHWE